MPRPKITDNCTLDDCTSDYYAKGYCRSHYLKHQRGTLDHKRRVVSDRKDCKFDTCARPATSLDMCATHYSQHWNGRELTPIRGHNYLLNNKEIECISCHEVKTLDNFYTRPRGKDNQNRRLTRRWCKPCLLEYNRINGYNGKKNK